MCFAVINCTTLMVDPLGPLRMSSCGNYYGARCEFSCASGYRLYGSSDVTCVAPGKRPPGIWDHPVPSCPSRWPLIRYLITHWVYMQWKVTEKKPFNFKLELFFLLKLQARSWLICRKKLWNFKGEVFFYWNCKPEVGLSVQVFGEALTSEQIIIFNVYYHFLVLTRHKISFAFHYNERRWEGLWWHSIPKIFSIVSRQSFVLLLTQLSRVVHFFHQLMVQFPHFLAYRWVTTTKPAD